MALFGTILSLLLIVANQRLFVYEDPRIDEVEEMLPHANCGACGTPGCRPFAERLIKGEVEPALCTANSREMNQVIANFLGVAMGRVEKRIARLACAGGSHVASIRAHYAGLKSCRAAALVSGGGKGCAWGCIGLGDCADVCGFDAIALDHHGLPSVTADRCTACGDCVEICPKNLFSIHPLSHRLWVACKNEDVGDQAERLCAVACTACERCAVDAPEGLIQIQNNLATVDYRKNALSSRLAMERCPTGAIVWLDDRQGAQKGRGAKHVIRKQALPPMAG
jgi:electron transport complex protein RnfB